MTALYLPNIGRAPIAAALLLTAFGARGAASLQGHSTKTAPKSLDAAIILDRRQRDKRIDTFLVKESAAVRVDDGGRPYGDVGARANWTFDVDKAIPSVTLRNQDYGRVTRLLKRKKTGADAFLHSQPIYS